MEIEQPLLGPERAQIALQALFFKVSVTVQQSISNEEEIVQHRVSITNLQNKSQSIHLQAFREIISRYPYSSLRAEDEMVFREMCLRTKTNILSLEQQIDISSCVEYIKTNVIFDSTFQRKIQSYVDFNIKDQPHDKVMNALKEREAAAKNITHNLRQTINRWIINIKDALKKRAEDWAKLSREFASFAPNETLKLLPGNEPDFQSADALLKDIDIVEDSATAVDHSLPSDPQLMYPTVEPLLFSLDEKEDVGKICSSN